MFQVKRRRTVPVPKPLLVPVNSRRGRAARETAHWQWRQRKNAREQTLPSWTKKKLKSSKEMQSLLQNLHWRSKMV